MGSEGRSVNDRPQWSPGATLLQQPRLDLPRAQQRKQRLRVSGLVWVSAEDLRGQLLGRAREGSGSVVFNDSKLTEKHD